MAQSPSSSSHSPMGMGFCARPQKAMTGPLVHPAVARERNRGLQSEREPSSPSGQGTHSHIRAGRPSITGNWSPAVKTSPYNAQDVGSVPGGRAKISYTMLPKNLKKKPNIKQKQYFNNSIKALKMGLHLKNLKKKKTWELEIQRRGAFYSRKKGGE